MATTLDFFSDDSIIKYRKEWTATKAIETILG